MYVLAVIILFNTEKSRTLRILPVILMMQPNIISGIK